MDHFHTYAQWLVHLFILYLLPIHEIWKIHPILGIHKPLLLHTIDNQDNSDFYIAAASTSKHYTGQCHIRHA